MKHCPFVLLLVLLLTPPALPCNLCYNLGNVATLRQDYAQTKLVLYGTLANPKPNGAGGGTVDLAIESVLKSDPFIGDKKTVQLSRYVPVDPKDPPKYLVFCEVFQGKVDAYRGVQLKSGAVVDYIKGATALQPKDASAALQYFFRYLDHGDPEIAADAYLEFAKASDQEVGEVAKKLDPEKLRKLLNDPQTPAGRLGLFAFLLGACGGDKEAALLKALIDKPGEKAREALDGILCGYIQLRPREGWELAQAILQDGKRSLIDRTRVVHVLRFYHGWKPRETRQEVLDGLTAVLATDLADLAIQDLYKWQMWERTDKVLALYGKKGYEAPVMKQAILRYGLSCPLPTAARFIEERRAKEADAVARAEQSLKIDQMK